MRNNKKLGNNFEEELCKILADNGYFAYNAPNKVNGQPFDIIATRDSAFFAFECKTCSKDKFMLSRLEDNQVQAFYRLSSSGSSSCYYLVCKFKDCINMLLMEDVVNKYLKCGVKHIDKDDMIPINVILE